MKRPASYVSVPCLIVAVVLSMSIEYGRGFVGTARELYSSASLRRPWPSEQAASESVPAEQARRRTVRRSA